MDFYSAISSYYNYIFPLNPDQRDFIRSFLPAGSRILEGGTATGNLARALARDGFQVVGVDLNTSLLEKARAEENPPDLKFFQMDMLDIEQKFAPGFFDGIVGVGNTLVHLSGREQIRTFLTGAARSLKPGGNLFLQTVNYDRVLKQNIHNLPTIENEKIQFVRIYRYLPGQKRIIFQSRLHIKATEEVLQQEVQLFPLQKHELEADLKQAGFNHLEFFGDFQKTPYSQESMALVVRASIS